MRKLTLALPAVFLFSACAAFHVEPTRQEKAITAQREAAEEAQIAAAVQQSQAKAQDYKLSGADLLEITVFGEKDMDRLSRVSQTGSISFPLVGEVKVGGLTVPEAEDAIARKLHEYLRAPQVTIFIKEYGNKKVFVFGQVQKPGAIELPTETSMTVLEAVSQAGGFTRIAAPDRTRVIRLVNGKSKTFTIEVSAITKGGQKDKDMELKPNDIVYVPESVF
jgi:polysaccharide export outer membrane protein